MWQCKNSFCINQTYATAVIASRTVTVREKRIVFVASVVGERILTRSCMERTEIDPDAPLGNGALSARARADIGCEIQ
jgi:hypothetical protein